MYDDLQNTSAFLDELDELDEQELEAAPAPAPAPRRRRRKKMRRIFGMTPVQLFVISVEVFMMVCILGFFFMILTEKMILPV